MPSECSVTPRTGTPIAIHRIFRSDLSTTSQIDRTLLNESILQARLQDLRQHKSAETLSSIEAQFAAEIAKIFHAQSQRPRSVVEPLTLHFMSQLQDLDFPETALTHLQKIHTAFWNNANSTRKSPHSGKPPTTRTASFASRPSSSPTTHGSAPLTGAK